LAQWLFQWAQDFSSKVPSQPRPYQFSQPTDYTNKTILGKILNGWQTTKIPQQPVLPATPAPTTSPVTSNPNSQWAKILPALESSNWTNKTNQFNDQWKYGYLVWFTKSTYKGIADAAAKWDARYTSLLKKLNFDTPENATNSAIAYINHKNTKYGSNGQVLGTHYNNPKDMYVNLYNASGKKWQQLASQNWDKEVQKNKEF
jgi:hypothetical protein